MDSRSISILNELSLDLSNLDSELDVYRGNVLKNTLFKKYVSSNEENSHLHDAAIADFILRNDCVNSITPSSPQQETIFRYWRDEIAVAWQSYSFTLDDCFAFGYTGPGSSIGSRRDNSFVTKLFDSTISTTSHSLYANYVKNLDPSWTMAELVRIHDHGLGLVPGSRLDTVPKDSSKNRVICVEPSLNMFYQLGAKHCLETILSKKYFIEVSNQQDWNQYLAKSSSIDGHLATIDLKNASDSISLNLLRNLLPSDMFSLLSAMRSPGTTYDGVYYSLNMISTMGNGFTFPLMTLLFASLQRAFCNFYGAEYDKLHFGTFGDDIIIPTCFYDEFVGILEVAGFEVNLTKSFSTGFFRESCGGDFYHGHDVRGVYCKELQNESAIYSLFNRLHSWALKHDINLHRTLRFLLGMAQFRPIPAHESFDGGFILHSHHLLSPKRDRNGAVYYHCLGADPNSIRVGELIRTNPTGFLIGCLQGCVRNGRVLSRGNRRRVIKRKTPCWDYSSDPGFSRNREWSRSWTMLLS